MRTDISVLIVVLRVTIAVAVATIQKRVYFIGFQVLAADFVELIGTPKDDIFKGPALATLMR